MEEKLDLKSLQSRINEIKEEGKDGVDFTLEFIDCLMKRHDLAHAIPSEYSLEGVPDILFDYIKKSELPPSEIIFLMDSETQNSLLFEFIWVCGMFAVSFYSSAEDYLMGFSALKEFESIIEMSGQSVGHSTACYLIAALALLMARIPTQEMISKMTNNFSDTPEQIEINLNYFVQFSSAVLLRYKEDLVYLNRPSDDE